jgi:hypothetical protein
LKNKEDEFAISSHFLTMTRPFLLIALALAISGCSHYATVTKKEPLFLPLRATVGALGAVEQDIANALKQQKRDPLVAIGELLTAAQAASQQLARNPSDTAARDILITL